MTVAEEEEGVHVKEEGKDEGAEEGDGGADHCTG